MYVLGSFVQVNFLRGTPFPNRARNAEFSSKLHLNFYAFKFLKVNLCPVREFPSTDFFIVLLVADFYYFWIQQI